MRKQYFFSTEHEAYDYANEHDAKVEDLEVTDSGCTCFLDIEETKPVKPTAQVAKYAVFNGRYYFRGNNKYTSYQTEAFLFDEKEAHEKAYHMNRCGATGTWRAVKVK